MDGKHNTFKNRVRSVEGRHRQASRQLSDVAGKTTVLEQHRNLMFHPGKLTELVTC